MRKLFVAAALACVALAGCASTPTADSFSLTAQSPRSILLLKVAAFEPTQYSLEFHKYDPAHGALLGLPLSGWAVMRSPANEKRPFIALYVDPGVYTVKSYTLQRYWTACFQEKSVSFDARPGEVVYLGAFDPAAHGRQVRQLAAVNGNSIGGSGYNSHTYFKNVLPPAIAPTTDVPADVKAFIGGQMIGVSAPPRAATYQPATFGVGSDISGTKPVCGGYYAKGTKDQK